VRLVGGPKANQGRLQTQNSYYWGNTCSYNITENEARVACRTIDYRYGGVLRSGSDFGVFPPAPNGRVDFLPFNQVTYSCPGKSVGGLLAGWTACTSHACGGGRVGVKKPKGPHWQGVWHALLCR